MRKSFILFVLTCMSLLTAAQTFEGKIVYRNSYQSKMPSVSSEMLTTMMGDTQEYYIKGGDYKSVMNGKAMQWQLYVNKDNKLYNKMATAEVLLWNDGAENKGQVVKAELKKDAVEILGYRCDELVLTGTSGTEKYYFHSSLAVDPALFIHHKFGNWYEYLSRSKALPLKTIIDNADFTSESIAIEVKAMPVDKAMFELPAGAKTMKNPY